MQSDLQARGGDDDDIAVFADRSSHFRRPWVASHGPGIETPIQTFGFARRPLRLFRRTGAKYGQAAVAKITPAGSVTEHALPYGLSPGGVAVGPDGNVWVIDQNHDQLGQLVVPLSSTSDYYRFESGVSGQHPRPLSIRRLAHVPVRC